MIAALIIGLVVGLVARLLMPGPNPRGIIVTSLLGIGGSLAATFIGQSMNLYAPGEAAGFISSIVGAMLILFIYHLATRK